MSSQEQTAPSECLHLTQGHIKKLMESLTQVSHLSEELGIALNLPQHVRNDCKSTKNVIRLCHILTEWIEGRYSPVTLTTLKFALEGPTVGRPVVAQAMVRSFTAASSPPATKRQCLDNKALSKSQRLIDWYSTHKKKEIPADTWPPSCATTFINLALINNEKQGTADYKYSLRRDVDDIMARKEEITYEAVFGQYQSQALVLVEGRPGSGKSTLMHKVTRDWATTDQVLSHAQMVFHITLRNLPKSHKESLPGILAAFYRRKEADLDQVCKDMDSSDGKGVCFIIDGLDEYQPQDASNSVIYDLIHKEYLLNSMVIVASRPVATATLREEYPVTKRIEVIGFTREQIYEYINKFPFKTDASSLVKYLQSHLNIMHMCYLPLHAAMICCLYKEQGNIPPTETKVYEHFTRYIVIRQLRRTNKNTKLRSLEDLRGENKEYFKNVCRLAYDMTIDRKQVIQQDETEVLLSHDTDPDNTPSHPNDTPSLGLVTINNIHVAQDYGYDNTYSFLHLTHQEYLTASYIATLNVEEQDEIISSHASKEHMNVVWKFYCGMVEFKGRLAQLQLIMSSGDALHRAQCALESQQAIVCDLSIHIDRSSGYLDYSSYTLTPADLTAVCYAISTTSHPVTMLDMSRCDLHDDDVAVLLRETTNSKLKHIHTMSLQWNKIGDDGARTLAEALNSTTTLHSLYLSGNKIGADGARALVEALNSTTTLRTLDLGENKIDADGARALAEALNSTTTTLDTLYLTRNKIGDDGARALAEALKSTTITLGTLNLIENKIGDDGARALAEALKSTTTTLVGLDLRRNMIGDDGACALAKALNSTTLCRLLLSGNKIGDVGAHALAEAINSTTTLRRLDLSDNKIGDDGARALTDLQHRIPNICWIF